LSSSNQELSSVALTQFSGFEFMKSGYQELPLKEMNVSVDEATLEEDTLANEKATELANQMELKPPLEVIDSASFLMQYLLLMQRILICARRNYVSKMMIR